MKALKNKNPRELMTLQERYSSVYMHRTTNEAALLASGSLLAVVDEVRWMR